MVVLVVGGGGVGLVVGLVILAVAARVQGDPCSCGNADDGAVVVVNSSSSSSSK